MRYLNTARVSAGRVNRHSVQISEDLFEMSVQVSEKQRQKHLDVAPTAKNVTTNNTRHEGTQAHTRRMSERDKFIKNAVRHIGGTRITLGSRVVVQILHVAGSNVQLEVRAVVIIVVVEGQLGESVKY
jgi:hypothetical protein